MGLLCVDLMSYRGDNSQRITTPDEVLDLELDTLDLI